MSTGTLTVIGTGIQLVGHLTLAAQAWVKQADKVLFAVADPLTAKWLQTLNPNTFPLPYNRSNQRRRQTYNEIVERIMGEVRQGGIICAVFYGHPGVFVEASHKAIKIAREEGFRAEMLPGISAEDCLFADLGLDPAESGCQSFEATDFLIRHRQFDPTCALILWQIAMIGNLGFYEKGSHVQNLTILTEELLKTYPPDHQVVVYEAAVYPTFAPVKQWVALRDLPQANVSEVSTLYVPAKSFAPLDRDMVARLGMKI